jgi:hypothetical protein
VTAIKLAIAMPVEGPPETARVHYGVQLAIRKLGNVVRLDDSPTLITGNVDVVRARDRLARVFLHETDCTALLWWDEDCLPHDLGIINRMLETGQDCVGAPYRRKQDEKTYPYGPVIGQEVANGCIEVEALAFGFMLTSRACMQRMWDAYHQERWYFDVQTREGKTTHTETVNMFGLTWTDQTQGADGAPWRTLLSEDYSFCRSWRAIGGRVMMYVGEGSPVGHIGSTVFRGTREGLVGECEMPRPKTAGKP